MAHPACYRQLNGPFICLKATTEEGADRWIRPYQVQCQVGVAWGVAVADEHCHVGGYALGTQGGGAEASRHREEDDRAPLRRREDGPALAAGHIHADDRDIGGPAGLGNSLRQRHRLPSISNNDLVDERGPGGGGWGWGGSGAGLAQESGLRLGRHDSDDPASTSRASGGRRQRATLPGRAENGHGGAFSA